MPFLAPLSRWSDLSNEVHNVSKLLVVPNFQAITEKVCLSKDSLLRQTFFHSLNFDGLQVWNHLELGDVMYLIWMVWWVAKWSQKLKGVTFSLTRNPRHNRFLAMTTNVNQLSVKTFNFPEFPSHKIRWKCSWGKVPLWPNVDILVGCSCHIGGTWIQLHFKVLPYWK